MLVLDVQSSVVMGALVRLSGSPTPEVIFSYQCPIPYRAETDANYLIKTALKSVAETVETALKYLHAAHAIKAATVPKHISSVHYILSSPWILSEAKTLNLTFPKNTLVTRAYILAMIDKESAAIMTHTKGQYAIIEQKISDVRLNGYSIAAWEKKEARELGVSFVVSIAGRRMSDLFIQACAQVVSHRHVSFHSSLVMQHIGIRLVMPGRASYTLIDIHGELTDLTIVKEQSCVFFATLPVGCNSVVRNVAAGAHTDVEAAQSLINLYMTKMLENGNLDAGGRLVAAAGAEWAGGLKKVVDNSAFAGRIPLPVVVPDVSHADYFAASFDAAFGSSPVEKLSLDSLASVVTFGRDAERTYHIALDAAAINSLCNDGR